MKKWILILLLGVGPQKQPVSIYGPNTTQVCTHVCCGNNATALPALNLFGRAGEVSLDGRTVRGGIEVGQVPCRKRFGGGRGV